MVMMDRAGPGSQGRAVSQSQGVSAVAPVDRRILSRALIAGMLVGAVGLAGCGRKGALAPPPAATVKAADPGHPKAADDAVPTKPDKPFFLDPLL